MKTRCVLVIFAVVILAASFGIASAAPVGPESSLEREVGHRLRMLPYYSVFAGLQRIKLKTEVPNAELVAAEKVYVPAAL